VTHGEVTATSSPPLKRHWAGDRTACSMLLLSHVPQLQHGRVATRWTTDRWLMEARDFLNVAFDDNWWGRCGNIAWSAGLPDLTQPQVFVKNSVCTERRHYIDSLKAKTAAAITHFTMEMLNCTYVVLALRSCVRKEGHDAGGWT
jgi:hypothetical protein